MPVEKTSTSAANENGMQKPYAGAKPTINDIARLAGVSKKTVSRVINNSALLSDKTREKVNVVIRETGFVPNPQARALALGRNSLIGLIHDNPNAQFIVNVQQGILEALQDSDFELIVRPVDRSSTTMLDDIQTFIERQRLYGIIILPPISENDKIAEICKKAGCEFVRMGSAELDVAEHMVASNDREACADAARYLIENGHTRIAMVEGQHSWRSARERRAGFEEALAKADLTMPRSFIATGNYTFQSGIDAAQQLLDLYPMPTAIFASNDEMAIGVLHAAHMRGIDVPRELSIIGFDDGPIAERTWPPLTTVRWPIAAMARSAALKLVRKTRAESDPVEEPSLFISHLVKRASVAKLN